MRRSLLASAAEELKSAFGDEFGAGAPKSTVSRAARRAQPTEVKATIPRQAFAEPLAKLEDAVWQMTSRLLTVERRVSSTMRVLQEVMVKLREIKDATLARGRVPGETEGKGEGKGGEAGAGEKPRRAPIVRPEPPMPDALDALRVELTAGVEEGRLEMARAIESIGDRLVESERRMNEAMGERLVTAEQRLQEVVEREAASFREAVSLQDPIPAETSSGGGTSQLENVLRTVLKRVRESGMGDERAEVERALAEIGWAISAIRTGLNEEGPALPPQ